MRVGIPRPRDDQMDEGKRFKRAGEGGVFSSPMTLKPQLLESPLQGLTAAMGAASEAFERLNAQVEAFNLLFQLIFARP